MPQFRKKPVMIEAVQLRWSTWNEVCEFLSAHGATEVRGGWVHPDTGEITLGNTPPADLSPDDALIGCIVTTTHGDDAIVREDDWIIPDSKPGTFYPCKPDVFEHTYEPADQGAPVDASKSNDPFAPEPMTAEQQRSAEELAPPNRGEGQGPGSPNSEIFPDTKETPVFPANRFVDAGASPQEIEQLQAEYDALDESGQRARSEELAAVATGDLVEELERRRAAADATDDEDVDVDHDPEDDSLEDEDLDEDDVDDDHATDKADADSAKDAGAQPAAMTGTLTPPEQDAGVKPAADRAAAAPSSPASTTTPSAPTSPSSPAKPPSAA